ncbi:SDR family oxidoreductase [Thiolinea disciformis]|uniref:SDR family oxidoreductase n=1 Tax=Thiolinea disciformis TaxID=125614 RepID=UPI0003721E1E|nr:SDR family oxidoreductase [Thiolinea disciformis]
MGRLWIMGCGDIGRRVAGLYQMQARQATGWVRSAESLQLGSVQGIEMRRGDLDSGSFFPRAAFEGADIFWFAPPPSTGFMDTRLRRFLLAIQKAPRRIVLISTTGVYGDCQGRWIDESEPLKPDNERSKRRLDAEKALQEWGDKYEGQWIILRVPGIYALDRLPLARIKRGEPVIKAEQAPWTNRIHADDLAQIAKVAMESAPANRIYNATDGQPSTMTDYFNQIADYAGLPRPPQISLEQAPRVLSTGMLSYLQESRRIRNDKLLNELKIQLLYPSLKEALTVF